MSARPIHIQLDPDTQLAGVEDRGLGQFTILFLHALGADLDSVGHVMSRIGIEEARKVAIDLPGHGLSSGAADPGAAMETLTRLLTVWQGQGWGPFVIVGVGTAAELAWRLAGGHECLGLCLVSPEGVGTGAGEFVPSCPVLAFIASGSAAAVAEWEALRGRLRSRWMTASMFVTADELTEMAGPVGRQVASHLQGFAREVFVAGGVGLTARFDNIKC